MSLNTNNVKKNSKFERSGTGSGTGTGPRTRMHKEDLDCMPDISSPGSRTSTQMCASKRTRGFFSKRNLRVILAVSIGILLFINSGAPVISSGAIMYDAAASAAATAAAAYRTTSAVFVDGDPITIEAYNIDNFNYFKLRAIAAAVDCAVWYEEETDTIIIDSSVSYADGLKRIGEGDIAAIDGGAASGGDTALFGSGGATSGAMISATISTTSGATSGAGINTASLPAYPTASAIIINGVSANLKAYNIYDYNYFKLRDFLSVINISVWYSEITDAIYIETDKGYDINYRGLATTITIDAGDSAADVPLGAAAAAGSAGEGAAAANEATAAGEGAAASEGAAAAQNSGGEQNSAGAQNYGATQDATKPIFEALSNPRNIDIDQLISEYRAKVVELVNDERAAAGVHPLEASDDLFKIAQFRCDDMAVNYYFSHESPTYGDLEALFNRFGIEFSIIGENIAMGHMSPEQVMHAWMESKGHRDNILDPDYDYIGVGLVIAEDNTVLWAQTFMRD